MFLVIVLVALSVWGIVWSVIDVRRDGYGQRPTDWSRVAGRDDAIQRAESSVAYR
ncbi:hypothetical protein [Microbacterium sp. CIAB417]|uniref:hypothetical protein n=1 Tax=Microbacterium sp. CIAB417 TaxID=2860287 RepID=UPI001FAD049F|nr:hypothetical protein [Microbacterium sp. CIAB417]